MRKKITYIFITLFAVMICILIYWCILAPSVSRLFISDDCIYRGKEYYCKELYLDFENGKDFKSMLSNYRIDSDSEIVDFYYVDNYIEDNPIYGKMCDIYALDVKFSANYYSAFKEEIELSAATYEYIGDFIAYAMPYNSNLNELLYIISFCDNDNIVRFALITEFDTINGFSSVFDMHTNLRWKTRDG